MVNLYDVIGVPQDSSSELIRDRILLDRQQLLILARIPRRAGDAQAKTAQLDEAERILLNPDRRSEYDSKICGVMKAKPSLVPPTTSSSLAADVPTRFCIKCGVAVALQAAFCDECGAKLADQPEASTIGALGGSREPDPAPDEPTNAIAISQPQPPEASEEVYDTPKDTAPRRSRRALGFVLAAALALALGAIVVISSRSDKVSQTPATPPPIVGMVPDARPAAVSLLNPPAVRKATPAHWDPQNIRGTVFVESSGDNTKFRYPDGSQYVLSSKLYRPSGKPSIASDEKTGTLTVSSGFPLGQQVSTPWSIQLATDQMRDINGDGWPEIVLSDYSGGAHCCTHVTVLSLRPNGPVCIFSEELGSGSAEFSDLNGDRRIEIVTARLAEYALGSFATGTYSIPVVYSAGSDGVYRVNTRSFTSVLEADLSKELAEFSAQGADTGADQRDTARVDLFFLNYLLNRKSEAYQSLSDIVATDELSIPAVFAKVEETLKVIAPEVLKEPEWSSLSATLSTPTVPSSSGVTSPAETPALPAQGIDPRTAVLEVIKTWVVSFKNKDSDAHADCYAPTVETYFKMHNVPNERILQYKRQAFSELLAIRRYDLSQVYISAPVDNRVFATFIKEWDTPTTSYAVYSGKETERLTFANIAGAWKIIREEELQVIEVDRRRTDLSTSPSLQPLAPSGGPGDIALPSDRVPDFSGNWHGAYTNHDTNQVTKVNLQISEDRTDLLTGTLMFDPEGSNPVSCSLTGVYNPQTKFMLLSVSDCRGRPPNYLQGKIGFSSVKPADRRIFGVDSLHNCWLDISRQ